jgi:hypothetical protein
MKCGFYMDGLIFSYDSPSPAVASLWRGRPQPSRSTRMRWQRGLRTGWSCRAHDTHAILERTILPHPPSLRYGAASPNPLPTDPAYAQELRRAWREDCRSVVWNDGRPLRFNGVNACGENRKEDSHGQNEIFVRMILPHPLPSPHGEGELLADDLIRRKITSVQGSDARLFRGIRP